MKKTYFIGFFRHVFLAFFPVIPDVYQQYVTYALEMYVEIGVKNGVKNAIEVDFWKKLCYDEVIFTIPLQHNANYVASRLFGRRRKVFFLLLRKDIACKGDLVIAFLPEGDFSRAILCDFFARLHYAFRFLKKA